MPTNCLKRTWIDYEVRYSLKLRFTSVRAPRLRGELAREKAKRSQAEEAAAAAKRDLADAEQKVAKASEAKVAEGAWTKGG